MKSLYLFAALLLSSAVFGQVTFTQIPLDSALVARDLKTNLGSVSVAGQVNKTSTPYDSVCLKIYRGGILKDSLYQVLTYTGNTAPFSFSYSFPAELKEYTLKVYGIKSAAQTLDTAIYAIVAGDVFIIDGQSNAFALMRDSGSANANKSEFIRTFSNADSSYPDMLAHLKWYRGEGDGGFTENGHVGQWGLKLARLLTDSMHIPVAIFNGASGGTPINYYMRRPNYKTYLYSDYARLYYRLNYTGLLNNVRAILWSQGETDAKDGTSEATYINEWDTLEKDWSEDFPGFSKIYIFQTRNGGMPTYPFYSLQVIKEAQRRIAVTHDTDIEIMSTSALRQDSGDLHFDFKGGYEEFATRIYYLVARDLYSSTFKQEIDAPMITASYLEDSTTLVVVENADSLVRHNPGQAIMGFELENANFANIDTIYLQGNKIIFELDKFPGNFATVSYVAQPADSGNWVTNTNNIETVCFYEYPISDSVLISAGIRQFASTSFMAFPNPSNTGLFTIKMPETNGQAAVYPSLVPTGAASENTAQLEVFNMMGERVYQSPNSSLLALYQVNLSGQPDGVYLYRIMNGDALVADGKLIISK